MRQSTLRSEPHSGVTPGPRCPARHGEWVAPADRTDPLAILALQATTGCRPGIDPVRRMAESAFAFYRGAARDGRRHGHEEQTGLETQLCGDATS